MSTKLIRAVSAVVMLVAALATSPALAVPPGNDPFFRVWDRTDGPVVELLTARTWMWGPEANTDLRWEPYLESGEPGRVTQMFDKSRMEITHPDAVDDGLWYVTNGLLVVELISGRLQIGDDVFLQLDPAEVNVAGDSDDTLGPTYATFLGLLDSAPGGVGAPVVTRLSRDGSTQADPALAARGIVNAIVDPVTDHAIAAPLWEFMNSQGLVRTQAGLVTEPLFINAVYATGRPITEPYWATVKVGGTLRDVLMQCFERRCLTYTPDNPAGWQVEAGNVGLHYDEWRYHSGFRYVIQWINADEGGTVTLDGVEITIPAGALSDDTLVTIVPTRDTPAPPPGYTPVSDSYELGLSGATLEAPVTVTLPYDAGAIPETADLDDLMAGRASGTATWQLLPAEAGDGAISLQTAQLSSWQVFSPITEGPYIDLNGLAEPGTSVEATFSHGGEPVTLAPDLSLSDTTSDTVSFATVKIENVLDGGAEVLAASVGSSGLMTHLAGGVLTISGDAPIAVYQQVLRSVTYANSDPSPNTTPRTIAFAFNNGTQASNTATATVEIEYEASNAAPVAASIDRLLTPSVPTEIVLSAHDTDSASLTFEIVNPPASGTLDTLEPKATCAKAGAGVSCTAVVTYTGKLGYTGHDAFTYRASDGKTTSATASVGLTMFYSASLQTVITAEAGGTIHWPGLLILTFPAGSLSCDAVVRISPEAPAMNAPFPPASNKIDITLTAVDPSDPKCINGQPEVISTVILGLYYDATVIPPGKTTSNLIVGRSFQEPSWIMAEPGTYWLDPDAPIIYAEVHQFSKWNVFVG